MNFRPIIGTNHNEEVVALVRAHTGADRMKAWAIFPPATPLSG